MGVGPAFAICNYRLLRIPESVETARFKNLGEARILTSKRKPLTWIINIESLANK